MTEVNWNSEETQYWGQLSDHEKNSLATAAKVLGNTVQELIRARKPHDDFLGPVNAGLSTHDDDVLFQDIEVERFTEFGSLLAYLNLV